MTQNSGNVPPLFNLFFNKKVLLRVRGGGVHNHPRQCCRLGRRFKTIITSYLVVYPVTTGNKSKKPNDKIHRSPGNHRITYGIDKALSCLC